MKKFLLLIISVFIFGFSFAVNNSSSNYFNSDQLPVDSTKISFYELQKIKLFPNPASELLNIDYDILFVKEAKLKIFNSIGAVVYSKVLEDKQDILRISVLDYENGIYFCSLEIDGKLLNTRKILINHR